MLDPNGNAENAEAWQQKQAFMVATFYKAHDTCVNEIGNDCTGKPLKENVIMKAIKEEYIKVNPNDKRKKYTEKRITFI